MNNPEKSSETYKLSTYGFCLNLSIIFLISLVISIVPLLFSKESTVFYSSQPFYIAVLLLFVGVMYYKWYGVLLASFTFAICGFFYRFDPYMASVNSAINIMQIILLLFSYLGLKKIKTQNHNMYSKGEFFVSGYNFLLILVFIAYIVYCTSFRTNIVNILVLFSSIILAITLIKTAVAKDVRLLYYTFMIALLPSVIVSFISAFFNQIPHEARFEYIVVWSLSNYILLQTAGYLLYQIFFTREIKMLDNAKVVQVDASSIALYLSILSYFLLYLC